MNAGAGAGASASRYVLVFICICTPFFSKGGKVHWAATDRFKCPIATSQLL